jgi:hypothetical protein
MTDDPDPESERKTEPAPSLPPCCRYHCEATQRVEQRYIEVIEMVRNPPWLAEVLAAVQVASAIKEQGAELASLKERMAVFEERCDMRHDGDPELPIIPRGA